MSSVQTIALPLPLHNVQSVMFLIDSCVEVEAVKHTDRGHVNNNVFINVLDIDVRQHIN